MTGTTTLTEACDTYASEHAAPGSRAHVAIRRAHMAGTLAAEKPARSWLSAPEVRPLPEGVTRTAAMLTLLATGPQPAAALAAAAGGIPSAAVSAILKTQIKRGQVRLGAGVYELVPDYEADLRDRLKEAASLLRANGYAVSRRAGT